MKKTIASCLVILAVLLMGNLRSTHAQDTKTEEAKNVTPLQEIDKDGVALSLIWHHSHWFREEPGRMSSPPSLVVWNDGRVLFGVGQEKDIDNWKYFLGKVEQKKITEMQERIRTSFRIAKKNQEIVDIGPDASYYSLRVETKDDKTVILTWQYYEHATQFPDRVVVDAENTTNGKPILQPEFLDTWKKIKADVVLLGETAADSKDAVSVEVIGEQGKFTARDKEGKVLAEYPSKEKEPVVQERR